MAHRPGRPRRNRDEDPRISHADAVDSQTLHNIRTYGWSLIIVADPVCPECQGRHENNPTFAYNVGLPISAQAPEVVMVGLPVEPMHYCLSAYAAAVQRGTRYRVGEVSRDFLREPALVQFCQMRPEAVSQLGQAVNIHHSDTFPVLQMVVCDKQGYWPWQRQCNDSIRTGQGTWYLPPHEGDDA
jgi:hypothetical protein